MKHPGLINQPILAGEANRASGNLILSPDADTLSWGYYIHQNDTAMNAAAIDLFLTGILNFI